MVDSDGKTHLDKSYCAPQKECFGGIVGAKSPYVDDLGAIGNSAFLSRCCLQLFVFQNMQQVLHIAFTSYPGAKAA